MTNAMIYLISTNGEEIFKGKVKINIDSTC